MEKKITDVRMMPIYLIDARNYSVKIANPAACLGRLPKTVRCYRFTRGSEKPCCKEGFLCALDKVKRTKKPVVIEHVHYDGHGKPRYVEVHGYPVFNDNGDVVQMIEYCLDITLRKEAESALRLSEERFRDLFENSPVSLWEEDFSRVKLFINGLKKRGVKDFKRYFYNNPDVVARCASMAKVIDVNKATLDLFRADGKEAVCDNVAAIFGKEVHEIFMRQLIAICLGQTLFETETVLRTLDGKKLDCVVRWMVPSDSKDTLSRVILSIVDVSAYKEAQGQLGILNKELTHYNKKLSKLALRDLQTGVYNYHYLEEALDSEFSRARRYNHPLSVLMLDIDYFKSINDVYGNQFGDLVLKQFAAKLKRVVRKYDTVIRYSGEKFVVLCPGIDSRIALLLAQRLLDAVTIYNFGDSEHIIKLKLSIAVTTFPLDNVAKGMELVNLADKIMDKAKEDGGGRVYSAVNIIKGALDDSEARKDAAFLCNKLDKLNRRANESIMEAVLAFAKTIELKDHYTGEHVESTVENAIKIASILSLSQNDIELIRRAAVLHDLGKIGISEKILLKKGRLTKSEFEQIKKHPQIAADILRPIHFLHDLIPLVLYHHERWDGLGYPAGLNGEEIPIGARIISIADVYQALTSDRPYRKAFTKTDALRIIRENSGTQFDPVIAERFINILEMQ